ncbi:hypothetical protein SLS53_002015 [Cytospora paraplurivora]|uniref:Uncharacterized protein n=1 Tax=Cytospora paraplurivora TaxID=2898453 RepID=A0AAN9UFM1_9PEZI
MIPTTLSVKRLGPRATQTDTAAITPAPQVDYPAVVCCDPSKGACTAQPTACVDAFEHPYGALCTGDCPNDPMTLKCTAGPTLHCNQIDLAPQDPLFPVCLPALYRALNLDTIPVPATTALFPHMTTTMRLTPLPARAAALTKLAPPTSAVLIFSLVENSGKQRNTPASLV